MSPTQSGYFDEDPRYLEGEIEEANLERLTWENQELRETVLALEARVDELDQRLKDTVTLVQQWRRSSGRTDYGAAVEQCRRAVLRSLLGDRDAG